jgi:hypothetical protein
MIGEREGVRGPAHVTDGRRGDQVRCGLARLTLGGLALELDRHGTGL